ncbi:hypothetical protein [Massilia sp. YIM B02443]|uniref:nSTAND1 domain-containing NTPase n=1 Tax=Massilia sp. YIM B02443 TaxID=3050127 RepID=UPI0025B6B764|nr:hypothetical protein [Massilia sp. YIM B02443]MDN4039458.1 hypothetical protein [Massilia sp. YIM B02443]
MHMENRGFNNWLSTVQGSVNLVGTALPVLAVVSTALGGWLNGVFEFFDIPAKAGAALLSAAVTVAAALLVWRSYRHFAQASRLERRDAFTLRPTSPETLIGRTDDVKRLTTSVKQSRIVLLDGESGCGKSALISAGLTPALRAEDGLLPVLVREWGEDWIRGPVAVALDGLYRVLSAGQRERLAWESAPDLAAATPLLLAEFDTRLAAIVRTLNRRPLLIADQFDDYQAQHRGRFVDADGSWLTPAALAAANPFWNLIRTGLEAGTLHLLVVARSDTAAGLSSVRFLDQDRTAARTLKRVNTDYLHPLLVGLTAAVPPAGAGTAIVMHPEGGWLKLRERLERDLTAEGAILMQQVRTVLMGLRELPLLTPKHYEAAGGLRGVETLVIARALKTAGLAAGGGPDGARVAAAVLRAFVLEGGPEQRPKAQRAPFTQLKTIVGNASKTRAVLDALEHEEVVRPADSAGSERAWQLDHDYLARAVLAHERRAARWSATLAECKQRFDAATGSWRKRYAALLPFSTLMRLLWERVRNRLRFASAREYILLSTLRPGMVLLCICLVAGGATSWNRDRLLTASAYPIINDFGAEDWPAGTLAAWRAPQALRARIFDLLRTDPGQLQVALRARWHLAHAGADPAQAAEVAALLGRLFLHARTDRAVREVARAHEELLGRLDDAARVSSVEGPLRTRIMREADDDILDELAEAYQGLLMNMTDADALAAAGAALRRGLVSRANHDSASRLAAAYATVVQRLTDPAVVKAELDALRQQLALPPQESSAAMIDDAYAAAAARYAKLADANVNAEASAIRTLLSRHSDPAVVGRLAHAYARLAPRVDKPAEIDAGSAAFHALLERDPDHRARAQIAGAYAAIAARLSDGARVTQALVFLRALLEREHARAPAAATDSTLANPLDERMGIQHGAATLQALATAYGALASRLDDAAAARIEAAALRRLVGQAHDSEAEDALGSAYVVVVLHLTDPDELRKEAAFLASRLAPDRNFRPGTRGGLTLAAQAYTAVVGHLSEVADVEPEVAMLRSRLERAGDPALASTLAGAYEEIAILHLSNEKSVADEARALRLYLTQRPRDDIAGIVEKPYLALIAAIRGATELRAEIAALRTLLAQPAFGDRQVVASAYAALTKRLSVPADLETEVLALERLLRSEWRGGTVHAVREAYAALVARLDDDRRTRAAIASFEAWLDEPDHDSQAITLADYYAVMVRRFNDPDQLWRAADVLERRIGSGPGRAAAMAFAYATVASGLPDPERRGSAAVLLRTLLLRYPDDISGGAYAMVAEGMRDAGFLKREAAAIRAALEKEVNTDLAQAYLAVAPRLRSDADLRAEADALRPLLERAGNRDDATTLAKAYAALAAARIARAAPTAHAQLVADVLTQASHPFLADPKELLEVLAVLSRSDFGNKLSHAVRWAADEYGIRPSRLRPSGATA